MPVPDPEHLLEQAERLATPPANGHPRQADLRRAISSAYYAIFHAISATAADLFVGADKRDTSTYELAYRSIDHDRLRKLCEEIRKQPLSNKYRPYAPTAGFGHIAAVATATLLLQEKRYQADYDPLFMAEPADALVLVRQARVTLATFRKASRDQHSAFLGLLLFRVRGL